MGWSRFVKNAGGNRWFGFVPRRSWEDTLKFDYGYSSGKWAESEKQPYVPKFIPASQVGKLRQLAQQAIDNGWLASAIVSLIKESNDTENFTIAGVSTPFKATPFGQFIRELGKEILGTDTRDRGAEAVDDAVYKVCKDILVPFEQVYSFIYDTLYDKDTPFGYLSGDVEVEVDLGYQRWSDGAWMTSSKWTTEYGDVYLSDVCNGVTLSGAVSEWAYLLLPENQIGVQNVDEWKDSRGNSLEGVEIISGGDDYTFEAEFDMEGGYPKKGGARNLLKDAQSFGSMYGNLGGVIFDELKD